MDIHAPQGHRIMFSYITAGYESESKFARDILDVNGIYTVDYTEVHAWNTDVYLLEFPQEERKRRISFNSVLFNDVIPEETLNRKGAVTVFTPDNSTYQDFPKGSYSLFLAGTIDNGNSVNWQEEAILYIIENYKSNKDLVIYNPRGSNWDPSTIQSLENPAFFNQVKWEQEALRISTQIAFNFLPKSVSVITNLEFGQYGNSNKITVCCPETYPRRGNIEFMCKHIWDIPLFDKLEDMLKYMLLSYKPFKQLLS